MTKTSKKYVVIENTIAYVITDLTDVAHLIKIPLHTLRRMLLRYSSVGFNGYTVFKNVTEIKSNRYGR